MGILHNVMYKAKRARKHFVAKLRDARGAFCRIQHTAISKTLRAKKSLPVACFFENLHNNARLRVRKCGTWRMKRGTRQGNSTGGDIFNDVYTGAVDKYRDERQDHQMIIQHGDDEVAVDTEVFVDDILEMTVGDDIDELHERLATNTESLVQCPAEVGSDLEPTKEVA